MDDSERAEKLDPRVERTRQALRAALIALASDGGPSGLSVSQVTRQAGLTRPTFYDHYRDLDELAVDALQAQLHGLRELARLTGEMVTAVDDAAPPPGLVRLTGFLHERRALLAGVLGPAGSPGFAVWLRRRLAADVLEALRLQPQLIDPDVPAEVQADFLSGALLGVMVPRLAADPPPDPTQMAAQLWKLLRRGGLALAGPPSDPIPSQEVSS